MSTTVSFTASPCRRSLVFDLAASTTLYLVASLARARGPLRNLLAVSSALSAIISSTAGWTAILLRITVPVDHGHDSSVRRSDDAACFF